MSFRAAEPVVVVSGTEMGIHGYITKLPPDHELVRTSDGQLVIVWVRHLHPYTETEREQLPPEVLARMRELALAREAEQVVERHTKR